jgi:hypothetical protein
MIVYDINKNKLYLKKEMFDEDGWVDITNYFPEDYEVVQVKDDKCIVRKCWWNGFIFDGLCKRYLYQIKKWKPLEKVFT